MRQFEKYADRQNNIEKNLWFRFIGKFSNFQIFKFFFFFLLLTSSYASFAQRFTATADAREVPLNYTFDITYEVENGNLQKLMPPKFEGFDVYGPSQSQNVSIVNGRMSKSVSYTYTLQPKKQGEFQIPAATAIVDGKQLTSNPINIKIIAPAKQSQQQAQQANDPFALLQQIQQQSQPQRQQSTSEGDLKKQLEKNIFVRVIPSKNSLYQGDQVTLSYKLYFKVQILGLQADKMPNYAGFLSEEFKLPEPNQNEEPPVETYNGSKFYVREFKRVSLFPTKSGKITIEPIELQSTVGVPQYHPFFGYIGDQPYEYAFKSNTIDLDIKPLPEKNKPSTFSGAVGKFTFTAEYDKNKCKVGEPILLKLTYNGTGNLKLITPPKLNFPEEFEAYEPKTKDDYKNNGSVVEGSKTFEYTIVPQDGGVFKIPAYEFAYFDVEKENYVKYTLPETTIEVSGKAKISENVAAFFKREKNNIPKGIYGIKKKFVCF